MAQTVKVYVVPLVRPVTTIGLPDPITCNWPGFDVTTYSTIALPPSDTGAVKETLACPLPAVAVPIVGASGIVAGVTELDGLDAADVPTAFVALTVKV